MKIKLKIVQRSQSKQGFLNPKRLGVVLQKSLISAKLIRSVYEESTNSLTLYYKHKAPSSLESFEELAKDLGVHISSIYIMPKSNTDLAITIGFEDQVVNFPDGEFKL